MSARTSEAQTLHQSKALLQLPPNLSRLPADVTSPVSVFTGVTLRGLSGGWPLGGAGMFGFVAGGEAVTCQFPPTIRLQHVQGSICWVCGSSQWVEH